MTVVAIIASIVLTFVGIVILVLFQVCFSQRLFRREERESMVKRVKSMSMNDLENLPCYAYVAKDNTNTLEYCAICLESLTTGDKCRLLPMCNHTFHAQCVDKWLLKIPFCPICRSSVDSNCGNQVLDNNGYLFESGHQDGNRESRESGASRNVGVELRGNSAFGSNYSCQREVESREHQIDITENQMVITTTSLPIDVEFAAENVCV